MSAFDYARSKATAARLLARFGQAATLRRPSTGGTAYNPTQGSPADYPVTIVVTDYETREVDGTRILSTDKKVLLAKGSLSVEPATSDLLIEASGAVYKIVNVQPLNPGGTVVMYTIQARR